MRPHSAPFCAIAHPAVFAAQWTETAETGPEAVSVRPGKPAEGQFTGDTHLSPLSAQNAGQTGLNRITQAVSSTSTWYTFAGQVSQETDSTLFLAGVFGVQAMRRSYPKRHATARKCGLTTQVNDKYVHSLATWIGIGP